MSKRRGLVENLCLKDLLEARRSECDALFQAIQFLITRPSNSRKRRVRMLMNRVFRIKYAIEQRNRRPKT